MYTTRIETKFLYPDGDVITVFIENNTVTDFGEAKGWLSVQGIKVSDDLVKDICELNYLKYKGGFRSEIIKDADDLQDKIARVTQAIIQLTTAAYELSRWK